jgi:hypothetical protein
MPRDIQEPTLDEYGAETHPAFAQIAAHRGSNTPGAVLFQSDLRHQHTITITITGATRKRDLSHDWVHSSSIPEIEVEMSEAQWASFVSSVNTSGVPCTIRAQKHHEPTDYFVPGVPYEPRMAESLREVNEAAERTYAQVKKALDVYLEHKTVGNLRSLKAAIENVGGNLGFVAKSMAGTAEDVINHARADIEALVTHAAAQYGIEAAQMTEALAILPGEGEES